MHFLDPFALSEMFKSSKKFYRSSGPRTQKSLLLFAIDFPLHSLSLSPSNCLTYTLSFRSLSVSIDWMKNHTDTAKCVGVQRKFNIESNGIAEKKKNGKHS